MSNGASIVNTANHYVANQQFDSALRVLVRGVQSFPNDADVHHHLGMVLAQSGRLEDADKPLRKSIELAPRVPIYRANYGRYRMALHDFDGARIYLTEALSLEPRLVDALLWLAELHYELGDCSAAIGCIAKAIEQDPEAAFSIFLARLYGDSGEVDKARSIIDKAIVTFGERPQLLSARAFWMNYVELPAEEVFQAHKAFGENLLSNVSSANNVWNWSQLAHVNKGKIHIAFLSQDFRKHSVAYFIKPFLENYDRGKFEVSLYYDLHNRDEMTDFCAKHCDHFVPVPQLSDAALMEHLHKKHVQVLVDLSGHTTNRRWNVFASKPVPLQITYLGYPNTTGLSTFDARIVDSISDPASADKFATEKLIRLPNGFLCYSPPADAPEVNTLPALNAPFTFGSMNAMPKLSDAILEAWAGILHEIPESRLLIKNRALNEAGVREGLLDRFKAWGVREDRLVLLQYLEDSQSHLSVYHQIDCALDSYPYSGTTTTCEAMWMGVPTLTLIGDRHVSRVGASLHEQVGLQQFNCASLGELHSKAIKVSGELECLAEIRATLRQKMRDSSLLNGELFAREFESVIDGLWQDKAARL